MDVSGVASSRRYRTSSSRPLPIHATSPLPHSFSASTLIRLITRSLTAWASSDRSLSVVKTPQSGFCPVSSVLRYAIRYLGMGGSPSLLHWQRLYRAAATAHQVDEAVEQIVGVVRAG